MQIAVLGIDLDAIINITTVGGLGMTFDQRLAPALLDEARASPAVSQQRTHVR